MKLNWPAIGLGLIVAYLILRDAGCLPSKEGGSKDTLSSVTTQVIDTSTHSITTNAPIFNIHVSAPKPENQVNFSDTNLIRTIVIDYLSEKIQRDSLEDDTIKATYTARIHKNSMERVNFSYRLKIPVSKETIITLKEPEKAYLSLGAFIGSRDSLTYGLAGMYSTKQKVSYILEKALNNRDFRAGVLYNFK